MDDTFQKSSVEKPRAAAVDRSVNRIIINVSGTRFITTAQTLEKFPNTVLGQLVSHQIEKNNRGQEVFFDADDDIFREVLRYHRTGELHKPSNMCQQTFDKQLAFWGIDTDTISSCCEDTDMKEQELEQQFLWFEKRIEPKGDVLTTAEHIWYFLTDPQGPYTKHKTAATAGAMLYVIVVVAQMINLSIRSLPSVLWPNMPENLTTAEVLREVLHNDCAGNKLYGGFTTATIHFFHIQYGFLAFFALEVIIRVSCCPDKRKLFPSINLLDLTVTTIELLNVLLVSVTPYTGILGNSRMCKFVKVLDFATELVVTTRCVRLLVLATVFR